MLGYGYDSKGQFEDWSNISDYSTVEQLNELSTLPIPNGKKVEFNKDGVDLTDEFNTYITNLNNADLKELSINQIKAVNLSLRKINKNFNTVYINSENEEVKNFIALLNKHNRNEFYARKDNAVKNSIVTKISAIIEMPSNQMLANTPIEVESWNEAVEAVNNKRVERSGKDIEKIILSPYDMFSYYKQQKDASVGKRDVGIAANGLKVMFALSSYYNDYYANSFEDDVDAIRKSFKTFKKEFIYTDNDSYIYNDKYEGDRENKPTIYRPATISDINISKKQKGTLIEAIGDYNAYRTQSALSLSSFTSAATDNAKVLLMAKVNASPDLASMHIYLMILGFTKEEIVELMTSDVIEDIVAKLDTNIFFTDSLPRVDAILRNLKTTNKYTVTEEKEGEDELDRYARRVAKTRLQNLNTIEEIYKGAQEIKFLSSILGVNQKTSANTEELTKFLTQFETLIYARENSIFGEDLKDFSYWNENKNSINGNLKAIAEEKFEKIVNKIFENNKQLDPIKDLAHVIEVLEKASNIEIEYTDESGKVQTKYVSLLGGKFDYRYYIDNSKKESKNLSDNKSDNSNIDERNKEYKEIAKEYYNLIKSTINIFDVIDNVPHFNQMVNGIILSYNMLDNTTKMFNFVQNKLRDTVRRNTNKIVFRESDINESIKNQMGNEALPVLIGDSAISKAKLGGYIKLKSL